MIKNALGLIQQRAKIGWITVVVTGLRDDASLHTALWARGKLSQTVILSFCCRLLVLRRTLVQ